MEDYVHLKAKKRAGNALQNSSVLFDERDDYTISQIVVDQGQLYLCYGTYIVIWDKIVRDFLKWKDLLHF